MHVGCVVCVLTKLAPWCPGAGSEVVESPTLGALLNAGSAGLVQDPKILVEELDSGEACWRLLPM